MSYVPFLKFKTNEISALKALGSTELAKITPFLDLPRKSHGITEAEFIGLVDKSYRKYEINLTPLTCFYLDNYDISDDLIVNGKNNYCYIMDKFVNTLYIPVIGLDRSKERISSVVNYKSQGRIESNVCALRVTEQDFMQYELVADEIDEVLSSCLEVFHSYHLIIDNRVCGEDAVKIADSIVEFIDKIKREWPFAEVIVTGSSIPASIRDLLPPSSEAVVLRKEITIARLVNKKIRTHIGDYACVSPDYSDIEVSGGVIRRVTAPKLFYPFDNSSLFIVRGGALDNHPRGSKQYEDLAHDLILKSYYRGATYSFGDEYLHRKSQGLGKDATPSTVPKPLVNLHMVYMMNDFIL